LTTCQGKFSMLRPTKCLMSQPRLPVESDPKQKDYYLQLRDKVSEWFGKNAENKPDYANYILLVPDF